MIETSEIHRRARFAYELGRAKLAASHSLLALPMMLVALSSPTAHVHIALGGAALALCIALFSFSGGVYARAVVPGLLASVVPLVVPLLLRQVGHGCRGMQCCLSGDCSTCLVACVAAGLLAGAVIGAAALVEARRPRALLASAALLTLLGGSLGCVVAGAAGVAGLALGTLAISMPVFALRRA